MYRVLALVTGLVLITSAADAQVSGPEIRGAGGATFEGLGDLPGGSFSSTATGVSADGSVVVGHGVSEIGIEAFRWRNSEMLGLGHLPERTLFSQAYGVSAEGAIIVGYSGHSTPEGGNEAFRWEDGEMEGLGDLPGGYFGSAGLGVSDDGTVVIGSSFSEENREAFRWEDGEMEALGFLPGGTSSYAHGASTDGSVVVGYGNSENSNFEAFRWVDGEMEGLGDLPGSSFASTAQAVSPDGSIVVGRGRSDDGNEAFRWENGEMEPLGDIPGGAYFSYAHGVSADGSVVVGVSLADNGNEAFLWTEEAGMRALKDVLEEDYDVDLGEWRLRFAFDVSHDGTVVVGVGTNPDGQVEAFRAFLSFEVDDELTPEVGIEMLSVPRPNPVRSATSLTLRVADVQHVNVQVFDALGRRVQTLFEGTLAGGASEILALDASALPAGAYLIRATGKHFTQTQRITILH